MKRRGGARCSEVIRKGHACGQDLLQFEDALIGIKSELVSASFRSFDDYSEELLVIGVERLEAGGVCETILFAHSGSNLYFNVDALSEQKVCSLQGTSRPTSEVNC
jgi:hypothetical protein